MHEHNRRSFFLVVSVLALALALFVLAAFVFTVASTDQGGGCEAALQRSKAPLPPGVFESCSSPYWHWGADPAGNILFYNSTKIGRAGGSVSLWDYVVAHERCHAAAFVAGNPEWKNERNADNCARQYTPDVDRWSPY